MAGKMEWYPGVDFHIRYQGRRMLDEPMHDILKQLIEGDLDCDYFEEWGRALFGGKLDLMTEYLGVPIEFSEESIPLGLQDLLDQFNQKKSDLEQILKFGRPPSVTVDGVAIRDGKLLLIRRLNEPFAGRHALPGGYVDYGERTEDAVVREVKEETGLITEVRDLIGVYSDPSRDPRGHTISAIYLLDIVGGELKGGDDALSAEFIDMNELPELAFDHDIVVKDVAALLERM